MTIAPPANPVYFKRFRPLAYILSLIAITAMSYAESNVILFFLGTLGTLVAWWLVERTRGTPLPRLMINLGVLAASAGLFYELVPSRDEFASRPNLLLALGHFMVAILLCKLFEKKSNRDYAQILTLTLLIMVAGAIVATTSLLYAIFLAAYLGLGLYAILLFHLRAETERALSANPLHSQIIQHAESSTNIRRDIRLVAVWSAMLLVAIAAAVFLLFPRSTAQDFFSLGGSAMSTGFTDHVRMQDFVHLHESEAVVMEVKLEQDGAPYGSESIQPYFRGMVLGTYDTAGKQWIRSIPTAEKQWFHTLAPSEEADVDYPVPAEGPVQFNYPERPNNIGMITQTYTLEIATGSVLFSLAPPVTFTSDQVRNVIFSPREMVLATRGPTPKQMRYVVESPVIVDAGMYRNTRLTVRPGDLGSYRVFDFTDHIIPSKGVPPAVANLARRLVHDLLPPAGQPLDPNAIRPIADRFNTYLRETYPYSMNFKSVDLSIDPTEDFLLNRKEIGGHCEFFASAMVMLCRAVGVNARMATGYHGGEYNSIGGFYVVKQKHAHAWVEVFLPRRGWTTYDPSPAARDSPASSVARWFQEMGEVLQKAWLSTVVAFDNTSRKYLFSEISAFFEGATGYVKNFLADVTFGFRDLFMGASSPWWLRTLGFASLALVAILLVWLVRSWNRRRTSQIPRILKNMDRKSQKQLAQDLMFFDDLLRLLARLGPKKLPEETPREYIEKLSPALKNSAPDARWLIVTFYAIRFGTIRVGATLRQQIDAALGKVRHELQHSAA